MEFLQKVMSRMLPVVIPVAQVAILLTARTLLPVESQMYAVIGMAVLLSWSSARAMSSRESFSFDHIFLVAGLLPGLAWLCLVMPNTNAQEQDFVMGMTAGTGPIMAMLIGCIIGMKSRFVLPQPADTMEKN